LTDATGPRRRKAGKAKKSAVLDAFRATTGYNRKYAITLLRHAGKTQLRKIGKQTAKVTIAGQGRGKRVCRRFFGEPAERAVMAIGEFFHRVSGARLAPLIRANLISMAARFSITAETRAKLEKVSRSTVERTLRREWKRRKAGGKGDAKPGTLLKQRIPVRVFWQWEDKKPGFCETGSASHDGGFVSNGRAFTLGLADAAARRSGFRALKNKARKWTARALQNILDGFPVPLRGLDSDNGAECINRHLKDWREANRAAFTRGRQHHKFPNCGRVCGNRLLRQARCQQAHGGRSPARCHIVDRLYLTPNFFFIVYSMLSTVPLGMQSVSAT
jgi:hypothetical protein